MRYYRLAVVAGATLLPYASLARDTSATACANMTENVSISINFNVRGQSFSEVRAKFDERMKRVEAAAKRQQAKKFELQSLSYNINPQQTSYDEGMPTFGYYQLSGNANYMLDSADTASRLAEELLKDRVQASLNVNTYRNGACPANAATAPQD